jgi:uncharacterized protein (DUF1800 family)
MSTREAAIAANRFGFGAGPGDLDLIGGDGRGWLITQVEHAAGTPPLLPGIPRGTDRPAQLIAPRKGDTPEGKAALQKTARDTYRQGVAVRTLAAVHSDAAFVERLVHFWSNHFTVSVSRPIVLGVAVPFENDAIRPHVAGRFGDMLRAVAKHPAMLLYLDNAVSIGPDSSVGMRQSKGLNENLARAGLRQDPHWLVDRPWRRGRARRRLSLSPARP